RALRAVLNAKGAFDQAGKMTRLLRTQENQLGDNNSAIVDQERAFVKQLIELYGTPYSASIGAGKTFAQGYTGPDLQEWFIVDRPTGTDGPVVNNGTVVQITVPTRVNVRTFTSLDVNDIVNAYVSESVVRTLNVEPN